jgi:hypothetical protein
VANRKKIGGIVKLYYRGGWKDTTYMHTEFELKRQKQMNHRAILLKVGAQDERSISVEGRKRHQRIREPPHNLHGPEIKPEEIIVGSLDECNPAPLSEPV